MIKKFFKFIFKSLLLLILLLSLSYGGFHLWEYSTGGKYVDYLKENTETIPLTDKFSFETIGKDIAQKKLVLFGEIHGFNAPIQFDLDFFKYLHKTHGIRHYFAEFDFVQAQLLNQFLETGNEELLKDILKKWVVIQGRNNKDYFGKYQALHQYYQDLPKDQKFYFIGIDRVQDYGLMADYLSAMDSIPLNKEDISIEALSNKAQKIGDRYLETTDTSFVMNHLIENLAQIRAKENREEVLFQNFSKLYRYYQLQSQTVYGHFGLYHVFQYGINGRQPLASKIRQSNLGLENKILSINSMLNDSYMVMPSNQLPEFMNDGGKYTKMPISADNMLFMYIVGVKDFKRMTPENHKSLINLTNTNNPYVNSSRLSTSIQILPVADKFEIDEKGKAYTQFTLFIRNSDWAEPFED